MNPLPSTAHRVADRSPRAVNAQIAAETARRVNHYTEQPEGIGRRLYELDQEWDIERVLETNAATLALGGVLLGAFVDRRFLALPALVTGFLLQHALQGWCPPVAVFRRRGVRTAREIERERVALKALRGDFAGLEEAQGVERAPRVLAAARG